VPIRNKAGTHSIADIDRLIHEPARYNIMALLYVIEQAEFLFVQNQTQLTPGDLSTHVSRLEAAHYLTVKKKFIGKKPKTFLKLTTSGRDAFEGYRRKMKELLTAPIEIRENPEDKLS
jgi:DNA-binding MarR family transcriptional regulator